MKKNESRAHSPFSEALYTALTDIDDSLIEEAEGIELSETAQADTDGAPKLKLKVRRRRTYLLIAACFAVVVVAAFPIINALTGGFGQKVSFSDSDNAESVIADDAVGVYEQAEANDSIEGNANELSDNVISDDELSVKRVNGVNIAINNYNGTDLPDALADRKSILSDMKKTELSLGAYGSSDVKSVYIVLVRSEYYAVYSADTYELLSKHDADSFDEVLTELGLS